MVTLAGVRRLVVVFLFLVVACRYEPDPRDERGRRILRVGYLPNVTHAPALVGLEGGLFASALGDDVVLKPLAFAAGPALIEALFAGELDVGYVGPNPAINGHQRSRGRAVRVIAGSTSGGAALVVRPEIDDVADLAAATLSSPALGNTQDVALRTWLHEHGLRTTEERGGTVRIKPAPPADIMGLFARGDVAGAWVPEPWASRLVLEAGGRVLVDERSRWPGGEFPTTVVIASTVALERRPDLVERFLQGHEAAVRFLEEHPAEAAVLVRERLLAELNTPLPPGVLERALGNLRFTLDPMEPQLHRVADEAAALGFVESGAIGGLVDRRYLPPPGAGPPGR